jgi:hypothetical protein
MHFQFLHHQSKYLIRHNFDELDLYFASHPAEMYIFLKVESICGIEKSESIFYDKIVGYDKKRRRVFICINMLMLDNEKHLHRIIREGIQEADTIVTISREDAVAESFILASQYCEKIGIKVAFGNQS